MSQEDQFIYSTHDIIHNPIEQQRDIKSLKSFKLLQSNIIVKGLFVLFANGVSLQFNIELMQFKSLPNNIPSKGDFQHMGCQMVLYTIHATWVHSWL